MAKQWEPSITVRALQPVVAGLTALGHDANEPLTRSNIARAILDDADGQIPHRAMMQIWQEALVTTADPHLGIHLAEAAPIDSFGVHAYATLASPTLREAYRRACRYQRLIHEVTDLLFAEGGEQSTLYHTLPGGGSIPQHPAEFLVTLWVRFGRLLLGEGWSPSLVQFAHDGPTDQSEHQRVFQAPLQFRSGRTAMQVENHFLDAPNQKADVALTHLLDDYAHRLLQQSPTNATWREKVRTQLMNGMGGDLPTAERIAQLLHISVRTLHRNLQREETSFRELLNQLRHEQATQLLSNPQFSITEVAFLLGYAELSSFYRAFKGWTGTTPAEFRAIR